MSFFVAAHNISLGTLSARKMGLLIHNYALSHPNSVNLPEQVVKITNFLDIFETLTVTQFSDFFSLFIFCK